MIKGLSSPFSKCLNFFGTSGYLSISALVWQVSVLYLQYFTSQAMAAMSSLTSMAPQKAIIAETGEHVDVNAVKMNTVLAVKAGDVIPIDGIVVEGKCEVDEKMLTGESFPVTKELDSTIWAGTINLNGWLSYLFFFIISVNGEIEILFL